ncbi:multidrug transporter MatE, partial [candidate division MSBL1 archaeon SCGC-AAA382A03]
FWVGQLSTEALAAIGFAFPLIFLFQSIGIGLAVAGSVLVAQYEGSGNKNMVDYTASQTIMFGVLASISFGLLGYISAEKLLTIYGASETVLPLGFSYLKIIFFGIWGMFGFLIVRSLMRGYGDSRTPMYIMTGSIILNIVLDPILIFGWGFFPSMGIEGAAIATIFSRALAFGMGLWMLNSGGNGVEIHLSDMTPDFGFWKKILEVGIPASIGTAGRAVSVNLLVAVVGMFSTKVVAGYQVGLRMIMLVLFSAMAFGRGVETMTGQNIGAGNFERAEKVVTVGAKHLFIILSGLGVVFFFFPDFIVSIFTNDPLVIDYGGTFLRYAALSAGFIGAMRAFLGGFRGAGRTLVAALLGILTVGVIRFPIAFIASRFIGPVGVWLAFPISNVSGVGIAYFWFKRSKWKQKIIE